MADNVVVIGKGRLIASTSMDALIAGNGHSTVFVRTSALSKLERVLRQRLLSFKRAEGGLRVEGVKTDDIGKLAFDAGVPILELMPHAASLEEAFLQMTAGAQEYKTDAAAAKPSKSTREAAS
jgi:ABC-2 type transport system ATP-binding protein